MLHDRDIREPLFDFLEEQYGKCRMLEEKVMGKSRADVVMVTPDALYGIEIKSDADTYARLSGQVKDYDQYYDFNYVVVGSSHALHIRKHVPPYWGVITVELVEGAFDFYVLRKPSENPKMNWKRKLEILWRPELAQMQEWNGLPKYKDKNRRFVIEKISGMISDKLAPESAREQISRILFERDYTMAEEILAEYRKGEIQKELEKCDDPERQVELIAAREAAKRNLRSCHVRTKRRRRRR